MNTLTLSEKKILLDPKVSGVELVRLSLMELIYEKKLLLIKNRAISKNVRLDYFLETNTSEQELKGNLVFLPFATSFQTLKKFQIGVLLKDLRKEFEGDFEKYKTDYVLKNLIEKHFFVENSIFDRLRRQTNLTEKGLTYKSELENELAKHKANGGVNKIDSSFLLLSASEIQLHLSSLNRKENNPTKNSERANDGFVEFAMEDIFEQVFDFSNIYTSEAISSGVSSNIDNSFFDGFSFDGFPDFDIDF